MFSIIIFSACIISALADYGVPQSYRTPIVNNYAYDIPAETLKLSHEYGVPKVYPEYRVPEVKTYTPHVEYGAPLRIYKESTPLVNKYSYDIPAEYPKVKLAPYSAPHTKYYAPAEEYGAPLRRYSAPTEEYGAPLRRYSAPIVSKYAYDIPAEYPKVKLAPYPAEKYYAPYPSAPYPQATRQLYAAPAVKSSYSYAIPAFETKVAKPHSEYGLPL